MIENKNEPGREIRVESMSLVFAKIMTLFTITGVILMVIPAVAYFMGINQYVPLNEVSKYWNMTANEFWMHTTHKQVTGYEWIFSHLDKMDSLSMIGVLLLMITPMLSMIAGAVKAENNTYRLLLLTAALMFIVAIFLKSLIGFVAGAKKFVTNTDRAKIKK